MNRSRNQIIVRTSVIGIAANVFLVVFKAVAGLLSHSVAIILDAVNNLSDALSSLITIIGTHLAQKKPDKKHPLGYGRTEYLSATVIAVIVLYAGIASLVESIKKIIAPQIPDYSALTLIIVGAAILVKLLLGTYVRQMGKKVDSDALAASGSDALFDAVISASTLVAAIVFLLFHVSLEAWLGALISLVIIKSGLGMLRDTVSKILGERVDASLARGVKECIASFPEVGGAYDLIIHNYGPERLIGSVHIELPDTMTIKQADTLEREIAQKVFEEHGVIMAGITVYSMNTTNDDAAKMQTTVRAIVAEYPEVLQLHGFYVDEKSKSVKFDLVIAYDAKDRSGTVSKISQQVRELYPDYQVSIAMDNDISD